MTTILKELYRHMHWADAKTWQAVAATQKAERDTTVAKLLHHIHAVQHAFLQVWTGQKPEFSDFSAFSDLAEIRRWGQDYHQKVTAYLDTLTAPKLEHIVEIPWATFFVKHFGRAAAPTTLAETLFHAVTHSAHHRGQVMTQLRALGGEPPLVDFIVWMWLAKPPAEWPAAGK